MIKSAVTTVLATLTSYHNEIRLYPCHLSVCSPLIFLLWLMLPVNIMKMQLIFSSNFFSLPPSPSLAPTLTARLMLLQYYDSCCLPWQPSWGCWKKKCWCLLWGSFYEGGATIAAAEAAQGSLMPSFCVPSPGQPFALNEETNYSRL